MTSAATSAEHGSLPAVPRGRGAQFSRQWRLLSLLSAAHRGRALEELAEDLETSRRTVQRDLCVLMSCGLPVQRMDRPGLPSLWRLETRPQPGQPLLDTLDLVVLQAAGRALKACAGPALETQLSRALDKITATLPSSLRDFLADVRGAVDFLAGGGPDFDPDHYDLLVDAICERRRVEVNYGAATGAQRQFIVHPYLLTGRAGLIYLVAITERHDNPIYLRLDRLRSARLLEGLFEPREDFDPRAYVDESFHMWHQGQVVEAVIDLAPAVADHARQRCWHPRQTLEDLPGGGLRVRIATAGPKGLLPWVLSWGEHARVVAPPELVEELRRVVRGMGGVYAILRPKDQGDIADLRLLLEGGQGGARE